jgi:phasin family protein
MEAAMKNDHMTDMQQKGMDTAKQLAQLSIENSQRILKLQAELAQELFKDGVASAKSLLEAKDPQQMLALQTRYAQEMAQKLSAATQKVSAVGDQAREQLTRLMSGQLAEGRDGLQNVFKDFLQLPQTANPDYAKVVQQAMATANQAFEQIAKASTAAFTSMGEAAKQSGKKSAK